MTRDVFRKQGKLTRFCTLWHWTFEKRNIVLPRNEKWGRGIHVTTAEPCIQHWSWQWRLLAWCSVSTPSQHFTPLLEGAWMNHPSHAHNNTWATLKLSSVWSEYRRVFWLDIGFIDHLCTTTHTFNYSAIADHTVQITTAHAKSFPTCCLHQSFPDNEFNSWDFSAFALKSSLNCFSLPTGCVLHRLPTELTWLPQLSSL
jgi:hypothetical protein